MSHRLLVVEDDPQIEYLYARALSQQPQFSWRIVRTLREARRDLARERPDALVLDWMLPDGEGLTLIKEIRDSAELRHLLVFMVTSRTGSDDCVAALNVGADDFMPKPIDVEVLLARLNALARRKEHAFSRSERLSCGGLTMDPDAMTVRVGGAEVHLHPKELRLLEFLLRHPDVVHPSAHLWEQVWGRRSPNWHHVLSTTLSSLRRSIGPWAERVENRRGLGYVLDSRR